MPPKEKGPVILEPPVQRWECAHCNTRAVTRGEPNRFHLCPGLKGIMAPMTLEEERGKLLVRAKVREDYEGADKNKVQRDEEGRPIMAVETVRDDGSTDLAVLAPGIQARLVME